MRTVSVSVSLWLRVAVLWSILSAPLLAQSVEHISTFDWQTRSVVGLSGLEVSDDGARFVSVSDQGWVLSGQLERKDGKITGVALDDYVPILGTDGLPVAARRIDDWSDAEGLAIAPDGRMWISFERTPRVERYAVPGAPGSATPSHPTFEDFRNNRQLETLAIHPDGTLYALAEQPLRDGFAIYRLDGDVWSIAGNIPRRNWFAIVGADFDRRGRLFLLERKLTLTLQWQNRIRLISVEDTKQDRILWTGRRGAFDNLEGIAVWYDAHGTRLTVVSDNNGDSDEVTQFVDFRVVE